jgi:hypothetical protein
MEQLSRKGQSRPLCKVINLELLHRLKSCNGIYLLIFNLVTQTEPWTIHNRPHAKIQMTAFSKKQKSELGASERRIENCPPRHPLP